MGMVLACALEYGLVQVAEARAWSHATFYVFSASLLFMFLLVALPIIAPPRPPDSRRPAAWARKERDAVELDTRR